MGFLDKAKKLAEQAQTKLDDVQGQFNEKGKPGPSGPVTEYDKHGRPIPGEAPAPSPAASAPPPPPATPGVPPTGSPAAPAAEAAPAAPPAPPTPGSPPVKEDRNHPSYAPPELTGGDPLAG
jgi:formin 2/WAS/WASL-interacting protein